jgi:hypothetical protein
VLARDNPGKEPIVTFPIHDSQTDQPLVAAQTTPARPWYRRPALIIPIVCGTIAILGAGLVLAVATFAFFSGKTAAAGPSVTKEDAQARCKTAFAREFEIRTGSVDHSGVIATITDVTTEPARATAKGFDVDGVIHYAMSSVPFGTVPATAFYTCHATIDNGDLVTDVETTL